MQPGLGQRLAWLGVALYLVILLFQLWVG